VTKMSSYDLSAFDSPNFPPLVKGEYLELVYFYPSLDSPTDNLSKVGIDIAVNWNDVIRQTGMRKFRAHRSEYPPLSY
jgi:lysophospholipase